MDFLGHSEKIFFAQSFHDSAGGDPVVIAGAKQTRYSTPQFPQTRDLLIDVAQMNLGQRIQRPARRIGSAGQRKHPSNLTKIEAK